jgi:hypothetical protein
MKHIRYLIWKKGQGAQYTYIIRKEGSIPENTHDGYIIGNLTGNSFTDSLLEAGKVYYYKAWEYVTKANITFNSDDFILAANLTKPEGRDILPAMNGGASHEGEGW